MITKSSGQFVSNNVRQKHHDSNKNGLTPSRKRTHLTPTQISSLQASFACNPLPDAATRHGLSLSLGMTERTVQIWFQNRRAKARKTEGRSANDDISSNAVGKTGTPLLSSNEAPRYQATFRSLMTPQLYEEMNASNNGTAGQSSLPTSLPSQRRPRSASKPEKPKPPPVALAPRARSEEINHLQQLQDLTQTSTIDQSNTAPLPVHLLRIGTWTRLANLVPSTDHSTIWDLLCYYTTNQLIWQVQAEGQQFRIQVPVSAIRHLSFGPANKDDTDSLAQLKIQLDPQQLVFTMCLDSHQWVRCGDFSEQRQASQLFIHEVQGYHDLLQQALMNMLNTIPELAAKLVLVAPLLLDDLCPNLTLSPSATPEPSYSFMLHGSRSTSTLYSSHLTPSDKSMTVQAPFYMASLSTSYQVGTSHWY